MFALPRHTFRENFKAHFNRMHLPSFICTFSSRGPGFEPQADHDVNDFFKLCCYLSINLSFISDSFSRLFNQHKPMTSSIRCVVHPKGHGSEAGYRLPSVCKLVLTKLVRASFSDQSIMEGMMKNATEAPLSFSLLHLSNEIFN